MSGKDDKGQPFEAAASLFVPLPKPPTATSLTVRRLIQRVSEGAIRVPQFQRPLRWRASDVVKLFDSILKGYPIGSLLFWKHKLPAETITVGRATVDAPEVSDGHYIVDGQQRVTALAATLLDLDQQSDPRWNIWFDPLTNVFQSGAPTTEEARRQVPLKTLGDLRRLGRWFQESSISEEQQRRVEDVQQRLLDYEIPGYVVETDDVDALRGVFARMNSTGVRMRAEEVFQALLGQEASRGRRRKRGIDLETLQAAADLDGFGEPPRAEILKSLMAMSGLDPVMRLEELGEGIEKLIDESDAVDAIQRTVAFLQASPLASEPGAGIPGYAFIPYPVVFIILARWFHLFPEPDETTRRALATWLWRGVADAVHQRAAVSALRLQVRQITPEDMGASLKALLATVGEPRWAEWTSLDPFHANHAASRVELLALLDRNPCDQQGSPVSWRSLISSGERVAREIFRVDQFERGPLRQLARTAANRALLDARHTNLVVEFRRWSWDRDREALESHVIDREALDRLHANDAEGFLRGRHARLRTIVSSFIERRAGIGQPRILPASSYYDPLHIGVSK